MRENLRRLNPAAIVVEAASPIFVDDPAAIRGKRVLVIEDGPTLTHGEMAYGAGLVAARRFGAAEIIDPRAVCRRLHRRDVPEVSDDRRGAAGHGLRPKQMRELDADHQQHAVRSGADRHADRSAPVIKINKPSQRVRYELQEIGQPTLREILTEKFGRKGGTTKSTK